MPAHNAVTARLSSPSENAVSDQGLRGIREGRGAHGTRGYAILRLLLGLMGGAVMLGRDGGLQASRWVEAARAIGDGRRRTRQTA